MSGNLPQNDWNTIVIYIISHANCPDGVVAAWVAKRAYPTATVYFMHYGEQLPEMVIGSKVIFVDFSLKRAEMVELRKNFDVYVYDHHKTAETELKGLPNVVFDMERSGAGIAWDKLIGGKRPWIIDYVEDRDLWRFALSKSKEVNMIIGSKKTIEHIDNLSKTSLTETIPLGNIAYQFMMQIVTNQAWYAKTKMLCGHVIGFMNATTYISEIGNKICSNGFDVSCTWFQRMDGKYQYSLRSAGEVDVSTIAANFDGGGHHNAAGFTLERPLFNDFVISPDEFWGTVNNTICTHCQKKIKAKQLDCGCVISECHFTKVRWWKCHSCG